MIDERRLGVIGVVTRVIKIWGIQRGKRSVKPSGRPHSSSTEATARGFRVTLNVFCQELVGESAPT